MKNLQKINGNQQDKYDEIIEYLKQDDRYWLENDKWDLTKEFFIGEKVFNTRNMYFNYFKNEKIKNEYKFYILFNFKNNIFKVKGMRSKFTQFKKIAEFLNKHYANTKSLKDIDDRDELSKRFFFYLNQLGLENKYLTSYEVYRQNSIYYTAITCVYDFINDFYDERNETEKDVWNYKKIVGTNISATLSFSNISFLNIPKYYRETVKNYLKTIITVKSFTHCYGTVSSINIFFNYFYSNKYKDGFLENLNRKDMENFFYYHANTFKGRSKDSRIKRLCQIRMFLKYIQQADYELKPIKAIEFLIFDTDIQKKEKSSDYLKRIKFIESSVIQQIDNNINNIQRKDMIPIYILLRETGWRGADVLNLRYNNCLEKVFNKKENMYNYYLVGEITKVHLKELKIPIREEVAILLENIIQQAKDQSTTLNNPHKYLFNTYTGHRMGLPLRRDILIKQIRKLIKDNNICSISGELHYFNLHSLRHTRAKEYVEQGMGISIIQQILGHQSLQMTVHYATVSENVLYEKWKNTEDLELFKVNTETNELIEVDTTTERGEALVRYEYVKKNLDAVRVPFGVCFKSSKLPCKQQMNHCLNCASFCTTTENIPEYEEEIEKVKSQIQISKRCGRDVWAEKNEMYLDTLEKMLTKVKEQKIVHKNGKSREEQ